MKACSAHVPSCCRQEANPLVPGSKIVAVSRGSFRGSWICTVLHRSSLMLQKLVDCSFADLKAERQPEHLWKTSCCISKQIGSLGRSMLFDNFRTRRGDRCCQKRRLSRFWPDFLVHTLDIKNKIVDSVFEGGRRPQSLLSSPLCGDASISRTVGTQTRL